MSVSDPGPSRSVALRGVGVISPAGPDLSAFEAWWRAGRPDRTGPRIALRDEPYAPASRVGEVDDPKLHRRIPDRKSVKLMFPRVQLGVVAALEAWTTDGGLPERCTAPPPERRAMYVGCGLTVDEDWTFREAIDASVAGGGVFSMLAFAEVGQPLLNPLWLVKGLSNNVLAFVSRFEEITGPNDNFMGGAAGGLQALGTAAHAIAQGRADRALAGASDSIVTVDDLLAFAATGALAAGLVPSQGAGFVLLTPGEAGAFGLLALETGFLPSGPEAPIWRPGAGIEAAVDAVADRAWALLGQKRAPAASIRGPRLPHGPGDVDLWGPLGDPGAAASGWLLAAAWALRHVDGVLGPIELVAACPNGEIAVAVLGTLESD